MVNGVDEVDDDGNGVNGVDGVDERWDQPATSVTVSRL